MKLFKSTVAKDLFKNYIFGYIFMIIIMIYLSIITFALMISGKTTAASIQFGEIISKTINEYQNVTDEQLAKVDGFIIIVNDENIIEYRKGNVIKEFEKITTKDYVKILKPKKTVLISYLKEFEAMMTMGDNVETTIIANDLGKEYSISYKTIEDDSKIIIFGVPYESISKYNRVDWSTDGKREIIVTLGFNILILIVVLSFFAKYTSKKFSEPIKVLMGGMGDITKGEYGKQLVVKRKNEFKELADGFNLMSTTIKEEKEENERLQQERNKLIVYISHDLKNPLAAVLGYSEVLSESENLSHEEKLEYLNIISKNSKRANKIITDLFDLSILESNDYKLNAKEIDINEALREIVADYIPELEKKEFKYEFQIDEQEHLILLDEVKFTRAISNLIDNTIKYNDRNTTLRITSKKVKRKIEIIISDDGKGISKEARGKIFEAFMREDKARNSETGGTGIGLAITKTVIEKHGGTIELVDSEKGTCYKIII